MNFSYLNAGISFLGKGRWRWKLIKFMNFCFRAFWWSKLNGFCREKLPLFNAIKHIIWKRVKSSALYSNSFVSSSWIMDKNLLGKVTYIQEYDFSSCFHQLFRAKFSFSNRFLRQNLIFEYIQVLKWYICT